MHRYIEVCASHDNRARTEALLDRVIPDAALHARFVNTLARLEYVGVRKMLKSRRAERLDLEGLQHVLDEAVHALRLKKAAVALGARAGTGADVTTFAGAHTLAGDAAEDYFQALDRRAETQVADLAADVRGEANYLLTSAAIEVRAQVFYPSYDRLLAAHHAGFSVAAITRDEDCHLGEMKDGLARLMPDWRARLEPVLAAEETLFAGLLAGMEAAIAVARAGIIREDGGGATAVRVPDLVIFDLDGTLADTAPDIAWSLNATLAEAGLPTLPIETITQHVGDGAAKLIERSLPTVDAAGGAPRTDAAALLPRFLADYAGHLCVGSRLYPGIAGLLGALGRARIAAAVVTNKPGTLARPLLDGLAPAGTFTAIVGDGDGFPRKPDPAAARSIMATLGATTSSVVVVGDGVPDMRMARALGARAIAAAWGYVSRERLQAEAPAAIAATPDQVAGLIGLV